MYLLNMEDGLSERQLELAADDLALQVLDFSSRVGMLWTLLRTIFYADTVFNIDGSTLTEEGELYDSIYRLNTDNPLFKVIEK